MAASAGRVLLIPKGTYNAATTYNMLDVVYYNGGSYVCKQTSLNNLPTDTDYWQLLVSSSGTAAQVSFDPTGTDMVSTNVQDAVVEVKNNISNPNLLINGWFTVNQRGLSSTSSGYFVDQWKNTSGVSLTLNSDKTISASSSFVDQWFLVQENEYTPSLFGKRVTVSAIINDTLYSGQFDMPQSAPGSVYSSKVDLSLSSVALRFYFTTNKYSCGVFHTASSSTTITIKAIKLEIGTISTLHLDTAPNYAIELAKCQASTADSSDTYANRGQIAMTSAITSIYATGSTNTTGAQIPNGAYFYLNGVFCRAIADIATSATFTMNTNYVETSVGAELSRNVVTDTVSIINYTSSSNKYTIPADGYVWISAVDSNAKIMLEVYDPNDTYIGCISAAYGNSISGREMLFVKTGFKVYISTKSGTANATYIKL